jgi:excisionase family DNA binding protein
MPTFQIQLAITLGDDAAKALTELLAAALKQAGAPPGSDFDEKREARLRASQDAIFCGQKPPEDQGLLIDAKQAAKLLKVSARHLLRMNDSGKMPPPVRIGNAVRWSLEVLKKWVDAGCPASRR